MKSVIPLVSLFGLVCPAPVGAAEKVTRLPLSIFCSAYAAGLKSVFVKTGEDAYHGVTLSTANVVDAESVLVEDGRISLHGAASGGNARPVVATAGITGLRQPLLVLVPSKEAGGLAYETKVVEGDIRDFPLGSFKFVNISPHPLRVVFGGNVIEVQAGAEALFNPKSPAGEVMPVTVDYKTGENWQLVSSANWASRDDRRTLVCFQFDTGSKRMVIKSVPLRGNTAN